MARPLRNISGTILALLLLMSGCFGPPVLDAPSSSAPAVLPPGTSMQAATLTTTNATQVTFRWKGTTDSATYADVPDPGSTDVITMVNVATTNITLPPGVILDVSTARRPIEGVELVTTLIDSGGYYRCTGRGPGMGPEWREVCHVRPAGPYAQATPWKVRVEALGTDAEVTFDLDLTVAVVPAMDLGVLAATVPLEATAADGVKLRGHVYLPDGAGPFATILVYSPYWRNYDATTDAFARTYEGRQTLVRPYGPFLDAGFAVALVSIRGTGLSEGCYEYMNHPRNGPDANAVIDMIAAQPWSNGRVGMYGLSYPAATQFAAIAHEPSPHLGAIVPMSGEWDEWNFLAIWGAAYRGAEYHPTRRNVGQGMGIDDSLGPLDAALGGEADPDVVVSEPTPQHWCEDTLMSQPNWNQLILNGDKNPWFRARDLGDGIRQSSVPVLLTNGLTDGEGGHRTTPQGLWDTVGAPQRWLLGQWPHCPPGCDYIGFAWDDAIPWFDHYLRGGPGFETGIVDYQDDAGVWHRSTSWPPAGANLDFFLSDGTLLEDQRSVRASQQQAVNQDNEPADPGACETTAAFVSEPFGQDTVLAGEFILNVTVTSTSPNGNVAAYLFRSTTIPTCGTVGGADLVRYALTDLRHRGHLEQGSDVTPDQPVQLSMRSFPFAARIPAGERLILVVAAGDPQLEPKPFQPVLSVITGPSVEGSLRLTLVR